MKSRKLRKFLMMLASALLLVSVTVGATVAYLTADDSVTNTFSVGKVGLTLDEANVDKKDADGKDNVDVDRDDANEYHLLPGKTYIKDPTVHIDGKSEDGILFVKVENGIAKIEAEDNTIHEQMITAEDDGDAWVALGDDYPGVYYYNRVVTNLDKDIVVFSEFTIKGDVDEGTLASYEEAEVKVTAYLIQSEGFVGDDNITIEGDEATTAWAAAPSAWKASSAQ